MSTPQVEPAGSRFRRWWGSAVVRARRRNFWVSVSVLIVGWLLHKGVQISFNLALDKALSSSTSTRDLVQLLMYGGVFLAYGGGLVLAGFFRSSSSDMQLEHMGVVTKETFAFRVLEQAQAERKITGLPSGIAMINRQLKALVEEPAAPTVPGTTTRTAKLELSQTEVGQQQGGRG